MLGDSLWDQPSLEGQSFSRPSPPLGILPQQSPDRTKKWFPEIPFARLGAQNTPRAAQGRSKALQVPLLSLNSCSKAKPTWAAFWNGAFPLSAGKGFNFGLEMLLSSLAQKPPASPRETQSAAFPLMWLRGCAGIPRTQRRAQLLVIDPRLCRSPKKLLGQRSSGSSDPAPLPSTPNFPFLLLCFPQGSSTRRP